MALGVGKYVSIPYSFFLFRFWGDLLREPLLRLGTGALD